MFMNQYYSMLVLLGSQMTRVVISSELLHLQAVNQRTCSVANNGSHFSSIADKGSGQHLCLEPFPPPGWATIISSSQRPYV